ncbi:MAG: cell division protein ZapA [Christensenellales bacterium]|nr:cell division protein ZapA [Christensenellales bacterium]
MQKTKTTVKIAGKDYNIAGYDTEEYVRHVAACVDRRMNELSLATHLPPAQLAVLTAVNAVDDMLKSREALRRLRMENERLILLMESKNNDTLA